MREAIATAYRLKADCPAGVSPVVVAIFWAAFYIAGTIRIAMKEDAS